jgi:hypothetical protein
MICKGRSWAPKAYTQPDVKSTLAVSELQMAALAAGEQEIF